jgi:hypothetical protein
MQARTAPGCGILVANRRRRGAIGPGVPAGPALGGHENEEGRDSGQWRQRRVGRRDRAGRATPKGRQVEDVAWDEIRELLGDRPRWRDLPIGHLHLIQGPSARHLRPLAGEMRLIMAGTWEVSTF